MREVAGFYENLANGLDMLGHEVTFYGGNFHRFQYSHRHYPAKLQALFEVEKVRGKKRGWLASLGFFIKQSWVKTAALLWCAKHHDTFVFGFGLSFFQNNVDLAILRMLGKRVVVNLAHGSDARPPFLDGVHRIAEDLFLPPFRVHQRSQKKAKQLRRLERYASDIIAAPYNCQFLSKPFVNINYVGLPFQVPDELPERDPGKSGPLRILHAPSSPIPKGTALIRQAIAQLEDEGYEFDYQEVTNVSHRALLERLAQTDLLIDQVYNDGFCSGISFEASWFGVPSLLSGYGLDDFKQYFPFAEPPPQFYCQPEQLLDRLRGILDAPEQNRVSRAQGVRVFFATLVA